jgi:hypothetical protein
MQLRNCVVIGGSGFNIDFRSSRAWSVKGKTAVETNPLTKTPSHSVIGAISSIGVINLSIRVPKVPPKVRRIQGGKKIKSPDKVSMKKELRGTTTGYHLRLLNEILGIMDKSCYMKGFYLIMDTLQIK